MLVGWYLETVPCFTVPCEGNETRFTVFLQGIDPHAVAW